MRVRHAVVGCGAALALYLTAIGAVSSPVADAAMRGDKTSLQSLLKHKADVNAKEKLRGTTALMWAVEQNHPAAVKALIDAGADVKAASAFDTKGARAYLAPSVAQRRNSTQAAGGVGGGNGRGGSGRGG